MARENDANVMNTTVIMYNMITDICKHSSPDTGIALSHRMSQQLNAIKEFNYKYIYKHPRQEPFRKYSELVITQIFDLLEDCYDGEHTWDALKEKAEIYPSSAEYFKSGLRVTANLISFRQASSGSFHSSAQPENIWQAIG